MKPLCVILPLMFYHPQELFLVIHELKLEPDMIPHQFLPLSNSQIQQSSQKQTVIIINKLRVNIMIHLITPFFP